MKNNEFCLNFDISKLSSKIWLNGQLHIEHNIIPNFAELFVQKLFLNKTGYLSLDNVEMTVKIFELLASVFQGFIFYCCKITDDQGIPLMLENIIECIPNVRLFYYFFDRETPAATTTTMKNIRKLKNLENVRFFNFCNVPEVFNVEDLSNFVKDHPNTKFNLVFIENLSIGYKNQLNDLIDTVIKSEIPNRYICCDGQDEEKAEIMKSRCLP